MTFIVSRLVLARDSVPHSLEKRWAWLKLPHAQVPGYGLSQQLFKPQHIAIEVRLVIAPGEAVRDIVRGVCDEE